MHVDVLIYQLSSEITLILSNLCVKALHISRMANNVFILFSVCVVKSMNNTAGM